MHKFKRGAAVTIGSLLLLWLSFSAAVDKFGHVGAATKFLPKPVQDFVRSPDGVLALVACAALAILWTIRNPKEPTDVAALHEANTRLQNQLAKLEAEAKGRRLDHEQIDAIARTAQDQLRTFWETTWPDEKNRDTFVVTVVSIGEERETLNYREDISRALTLGGLRVVVHVWPAGQPRFEALANVVAVLHRQEPAPLRTVVVNALKAGRVDVRETTDPTHDPTTLTVSYTIATVVVGQRR